MVATGSSEQLSGTEMLKRWQALYGQAQAEGLQARRRQEHRLGQQQPTAPQQRINSVDGASGQPYYSPQTHITNHNETLM